MKQETTASSTRLPSADGKNSAEVSFRPPLQFRSETASPASPEDTDSPSLFSFKSPQPFQRKTPPESLTVRQAPVTMPFTATIQRAKEVVAPGNATTIPDMTAGQVQTFEASRTPQDTLDNMRTMNLLNGLKGIPPLDEIGIYYSEDAAIYGQAFYDDTKDPKYWILVYKTAFEKGLPVVYSTLRHELIHIGQYYKQIKAANNEALDTDIVFDSTLDDRESYKPAANAASEIETYAWEICNAGSTGVDKSYLYTRAIGLEQHWPQLKAPGSGSALFKSTINGWRNKVKGLRDAAIVSFDAVMDPVKWPTHDSAHTYDAELQRVAPAQDVEM